MVSMDGVERFAAFAGESEMQWGSDWMNEYLGGNLKQKQKVQFQNCLPGIIACPPSVCIRTGLLGCLLTSWNQQNASVSRKVYICTASSNTPRASSHLRLLFLTYQQVGQKRSHFQGLPPHTHKIYFHAATDVNQTVKCAYLRAYGVLDVCEAKIR